MKAHYFTLLIFSFILVSLGVNAQSAKAIILVYLDGGPSQTDTFDPKLEVTRDFSGLFRDPIETNIPGVYINQKFPLLAKLTDKYSLIRSMTHGINGHETAHYAMITGDMTGGSVVYPSFGTVISYLNKDKYKGLLPPYVSLVAANSRFNEGGFLGNDYKSFETNGQPEKSIFEVDGIVNRLVNKVELNKRLTLLSQMEQANSLSNQTKSLTVVDSLRKRNSSLLFGKLTEVFDLNAESKELRERYGMTRIGQSCLVARKLVEAGVLVVNVRTTGWDTHKSHFVKMNEMLPELDKALSALLTDLSEKGLLESTIVVCGGEFGRTPKVQYEAPWNGGRTHFGQAFSYLVAGGGFIPGKVIGATDKTGENIVDRKVYPSDFIATLYTLLGIKLDATLPHASEGNLPILPSYGKANQSNGLLKELIK